MKKYFCLVFALLLIALQLPAVVSSNGNVDNYPQPIFIEPVVEKPDTSMFSGTTAIYATGLLNPKTNDFKETNLSAGISTLINFKLDNLFLDIDIAFNHSFPNKLINPSAINFGVGLDYIFPLSTIAYPYAGIKGGLMIRFWEDAANNPMNEATFEQNVDVYAQLDAGVLIYIPGSICTIKLAGSGAYMDKEFRYGATLGLIFKFF